MAEVAPCITVESMDDYQAAIERLKPFAERVHIDISDGEFAPTNLVGADQLSWPSEWRVDIHAMVTKPSQHLDALIERKPHTIILHAEANENLLPIINHIKQAGIRTGLALLKTTVPKTISGLLEIVDHALIFSGNLGHYGGKASMMQLEKVRLVRMIHPDIEVGWDGGASLDNAYSLSQGGVDVINSGGAINSADDPEAVYRKMVSEINKQSVL